MLKKIFLAGSAVLLLPACASIDRGLNDHVRVDTVPQGATVSIRHIPFKDSVRQPGAIERATCDATPCALEVRRSQRGIVSIEKDGFETAEYYFGPSRYRAGGSVDLANSALATTSISLGAGVTLGLVSAGLTQFSASLVNAITLGLGNAQGISSASGAAAGTGVGLGIAAGSMVIDAASGANLNIYPNPVVIGLAPIGTPVEDDSFVDAYETLIRAYTQQERSCSERTRGDETIECYEAVRTYRSARSTLVDLENERDDAIKVLIEAQKDAQKAMEAAQ